MHENKKIIAIITARGGSKRLKDKNILDFAGKPLIAWTILAAKGSKYIDEVLISTDSEAIAKVSKQFKAHVPYMRPAALAQDNSSSLDVIRHAMTWTKAHQRTVYDYILLLQPTSPLRTTQHIDQGIEYYFGQKKSDNDTLVSVAVADPGGKWLMHSNSAGYIEFVPQGAQAKPQEDQGLYQPNGAIFFGPAPEVVEMGFYNGLTMPFMMEGNESVDIDSAEDLEKALTLFKQRNVLEEV